MSKLPKEISLAIEMFLLILFILLLQFQPASAQTRNCAERSVVVGRLTNAYGETRQSIGLGGGNVVVEVFASDETGTWTITVTKPGGLTCLVASGQAYEELSEELVPAGDPL